MALGQSLKNDILLARTLNSSFGDGAIARNIGLTCVRFYSRLTFAEFTFMSHTTKVIIRQTPLWLIIIHIHGVNKILVNVFSGDPHKVYG